MRGIPVSTWRGGLRTLVRRRAAAAPAGKRFVAVVGAVGILAASVSACTSSSAPTAAAPTGPTAPQGASTLPPSLRPATTPVPAPTPGNISQRVRTASVAVHSPVPLGKAGSFASGIAVRILAAKTFHARAHRPGEISGPAVRVNAEITNNTGKAISLAGLAVTCAEGNGKTPLVSFLSPPARPFRGTLAGGAHARAVYVFELSHGSHATKHSLTFKLGNSATKSIVQFYGKVS
jgi:hypothetical protein